MPPKSTGSNVGGYAAAGGLGAAGGYAAGNLGKTSSLGAGGFVKPGSTGGIGGGGFVNPSAGKPGFQGSSYPQPSAPSLSRTNSFGGGGVASHGLAGAAGAVGGYGLGKTSRYSWPKSSMLGVGKHHKSAYNPGYGTKFGTSFGAANMYKQKKGFSKKALGLGVAAGFVGGAALGVAGTMATYSAYHRYQHFKNMMSMRGFNDYDDDRFGFGNNYRSSYYSNNQCFGGCPMNSHCEWGFCECNAGYERRYGQCGRLGGEFIPRARSFDPFAACSVISTCQAIDINMICNTNITVQAGGKCQCKPDMKWNEATGECQIFIDVDCTKFTYETPPSQLILAAAEKAEKSIPSNRTIPNEAATPTIEESLGTSLLTKLDQDQATANDLKEAFCRDVDAFSFDMNIDDSKPPNCDPVPRTACGVVYDSSSCSGGWRLIISEGAISFPYFSSYWKYRNDIDLIGVKAGCTLTAFSSTGFSGQRGTLRADARDQWWVLAEHAEFSHLDSDIESLQCVCRRM